MKRVALITGGTRGIGYAIARCLVQEGCDLAVCGLRKANAVADPIANLRTLGARVFYRQADIADVASHGPLLEAVQRYFGQLHVLVNNAGMAPTQRADILEAKEESFDALIRTNLRGPYFFTQRVARWLIELRNADASFRGCVINISSVSAEIASTDRGDYCISKAGIAMATKLWAARLGEYDIPVYEVRPGIIKTDMTAAVTAKYDKLFAAGMAVQPRWGTPENVGAAVAALVRGDFAYSTGAVFMVDGGMTVQRL
jgi:3-oxoacyl-[acyl-carrier protein] reductase